MQRSIRRTPSVALVVATLGLSLRADADVRLIPGPGQVGSSVLGLNDAGRALTSSGYFGGPYPYAAARWDAAGVERLYGPNGPPSTASTSAINRAGAVIGYCGGPVA